MKLHFVELNPKAMNLQLYTDAALVNRADRSSQLGFVIVSGEKS